jgi:hypothetical protein
MCDNGNSILQYYNMKLQNYKKLKYFHAYEYLTIVPNSCPLQGNTSYMCKIVIVGTFD